MYALADAWDWLVGGLTKMWNTVVGFIAGKLAQLLELIGLADKGLDLKITEETTNKNAGVDRQNAQRSERRQRDVAAIGAERQDVNTAIRDDQVRSMMKRDAGVEAARAELDQARAAAAAARKNVSARVASKPVDVATPAPIDLELPDLSNLEAAIAAVPETVTATAAQLDVAGGFSSAALSQLGVGDSAGERTAKAAEETAKNTQRLLRAVEDGDGLVFG